MDLLSGGNPPTQQKRPWTFRLTGALAASPALAGNRAVVNLAPRAELALVVQRAEDEPDILARIRSFTVRAVGRAGFNGDKGHRLGIGRRGAADLIAEFGTRHTRLLVAPSRSGQQPTRSIVTMGPQLAWDRKAVRHPSQVTLREFWSGVPPLKI